MVRTQDGCLLVFVGSTSRNKGKSLVRKGGRLCFSTLELGSKCEVLVESPGRAITPQASLSIESSVSLEVAGSDTIDYLYLQGLFYEDPYAEVYLS
jgi:hypothetical protein